MVTGFRYAGNQDFILAELATGVRPEEKERKKELIAKTEENMARAGELQEALMAESREALVVAIQARDAAGKDSLIRHLFGKLNPNGMEVHSFKTPNSTELSHDYLWRISQALPARGKIGIFNRSHYEDVLVTRVYRMEEGFRIPERCLTPDFYERRYRQLRNWEEYLYENGIRMVKIFLNVGKEAQKTRFLDRMDMKEKHYKLSLSDLDSRDHWDEFEKAYEDCIKNTGTAIAPWYVVPADQKWYTRYRVSEILLATLTEMDPKFPLLSQAEMEKIPAVRAHLDADDN